MTSTKHFQGYKSSSTQGETNPTQPFPGIISTDLQSTCLPNTKCQNADSNNLSPEKQERPRSYHYLGAMSLQNDPAASGGECQLLQEHCWIVDFFTARKWRRLRIKLWSAVIHCRTWSWQQGLAQEVCYKNHCMKKGTNEISSTQQRQNRLRGIKLLNFKRTSVKR